MTVQYLAKLPFVNGQFTNEADAKLVEALRKLAKRQKKVIRFRYNGPRRSKDTTRNRYACQSMCLKRNATEVRVYFYDN